MKKAVSVFSFGPPKSHFWYLKTGTFGNGTTCTLHRHTLSFDQEDAIASAILVQILLLVLVIGASATAGARAESKSSVLQCSDAC